MRIYLDHNATTPLRAEVVQAMTAVLQGDFGNPTSTHEEGARARAQVEKARGQVARLLGTKDEAVIFTAGASEANNTVLYSLLDEVSSGRGLVTSAVEHPSVLEPARQLEKAGLPVSWIPVDGEGRVDPGDVIQAAEAGAALVSLIWANNETGVIQPIEEIALALDRMGVPLHVDATQAVGKWIVDLTDLPIPYLSCSAHKLNGPKGSGCLIARGPQPLRPLVRGGPQERKQRGGTENVAGIVGLGLACELASHELSERIERDQALRDQLWEELQQRMAGLSRNGSQQHVLPNTLNVEVAGAPGEVMVQALDLEGIAVSMGAACHSGSISPSHVLAAMGLSPEQTRSSLRLSVGQGITPSDITTAAERIAHVAQRARKVQSG
ncbi:MAG: cysteine desulfurase family protein [Myxococcota bacterium]|nr:cysteine desulfurase family protein [Myxococcota bacterium]